MEKPFICRLRLLDMSIWLPLGFYTAILTLLALTSDISSPSLFFSWILPAISHLTHACVVASDNVVFNPCFEKFVYSWPICLPLALFDLALPLLPTCSIHFISSSNSSAFSFLGMWMLSSALACLSCCHLSNLDFGRRMAEARWWPCLYILGRKYVRMGAMGEGNPLKLQVDWWVL